MLLNAAAAEVKNSYNSGNVTAGGMYTVTVTAGSCATTSTATMVTVNPLPAAPVVTPTVTYCQNAVATALTATGTGLKWYTVLTGGTALANTPTPITTAGGTANYYVSQTTNSCESTRSSASVMVNEVPIATITPVGSTSILQGGSVILKANSGMGLSYKWFNGTALLNTDASYTATDAGRYSVEVTNAFGYSAISSVTNVGITQKRPSVITITSLQQFSLLF